MFGATSTVHGVLGTPELDLASYTELRMRRNPAFVFFSRGNSALPQLTAAGALVELELLGEDPVSADSAY